MESDRFFALSMDMLCVVDRDGYFQRLNPVWEKTLGFDKQALFNHPWIELVHPDDRALTLDHINFLAQDPISFENRCRCQDGTYKWLLWKVTLCTEQQSIYAVVRDITERKRSRQALQDSEERFRHLVESVKDYAIYMLDPDGLIVSWNQGAERINGYTEAEILGQPVSRLYPSEDVRSGKPDYELAVAAATGRFEDESCRVRQDGSQFWAHAIVTALRDRHGNLRGFAKVTRDITERKQAEEALRKAYDTLEKRVEERTSELLEANRLLHREIAERTRAEAELRQSAMQLRQQTQQLQQTLSELKQTQAQLIQSEKMSSLGQLVAGVAHEINNPVNFIYGNLKFASQYFQDLLSLLSLYDQFFPDASPEIRSRTEAINFEFLKEDLPRMLHSMRVGADRIREIVLSLKNFSRLDEAEKKFVNIHEGLDNTLLILQNRLKAKPHFPAIAVVKQYDDLPLVDCYAGQLNQVFMNILSNAIDALEERSEENDTDCTPTIQIRTQVIRNNWISIQIADNGSGVCDCVKQQLFDPFFTTKPVGKGTGLGLSISYQIIVEKHGGRLKCSSTPGQGTEFAIEIPIYSSVLE